LEASDDKVISEKSTTQILKAPLDADKRSPSQICLENLKTKPGFQPDIDNNNEDLEISSDEECRLIKLHKLRER